MSAKDRSVRFWDKIAQRYSARPVSDQAAYQKKLKITREYFRPDMRVLEFGCGTGSTAMAHAPYVKHILATDISSKMVEIAKSKAAAENVDNVTFQVGALEDLDIPEHSVDAVLGLSILHLLENRETAIRNVHKLLKPGGIFVSSTACLGDKMKWFGLIGPIGCALGLIPLVRVFSRSELENSLTAAGFELDRVWQPDKGIAVIIVARA